MPREDAFFVLQLLRPAPREKGLVMTDFLKTSLNRRALLQLIDGVLWDGKEPKTYADGFKLHA